MYGVNIIFVVKTKLIIIIGNIC